MKTYLTPSFEIPKEEYHKSLKCFSEIQLFYKKLGKADSIKDLPYKEEFQMKDSSFFNSSIEKSLGDSACEIIKSPSFQSSPGSISKFKMQKIEYSSK